MMSRRVPRHVRVFLASPGDVAEERQAVRTMLQRLERSPLIREDFTIEAVSWDDPDAPAPMLATLTPQQAVSRALPTPSECDITVVVVYRRMGTPLDERKADGTPYRSGTEWEFEDARRAGRPILLYRRTTPSASSVEGPDEAQQISSVEEFFSQFKKPNGVLSGGVTTYSTVDELVSRLRTDIETLLPALRSENEVNPRDLGWAGRAQRAVRDWHVGRLLLFVGPGVLATIVAWTAFTAFATIAGDHEAPLTAYVLRYIFLSVGLLVPCVLFVLTWWWLGRKKPNPAP